VILGDIGTGKTTLSRKLIHELRLREDFIFYMMLNPYFETEEVFLTTLLNHFGILPSQEIVSMSMGDMMNTFERFLLQKAVNEGKTLTLILDEAQKITPSTLETLRIFLNFETNEYKLLQVVMLGQLELVPKIINMQNFYDRISLKYVLNPFDYLDTKKMILYRIHQGGRAHDPLLFTDSAMNEISRFTMGYPRRITMICHKALKELVIQRKDIIDEDLIRDLISRENEVTCQRTSNLQRKIS